jgi:7-keto-8-aminopelargonate synthetase-like enzyme
VEKLNQNASQFIYGIKQRGFDTLYTSTAIVPVICGTDEAAFAMTQAAQHQDTFVLPVVSPAVPPGLSRLRATVTAAHETDEIEQAMDVIYEAGKQIGLVS